LIRNAARNYLLDYGIHWGAAPAVKGIRDAALDLLHILVAVHAEVSISTFPLIIKIVHLSFALDVHQLLINHKFTSIALYILSSLMEYCICGFRSTPVLGLCWKRR
jgi:hypothetical protein